MKVLVSGASGFIGSWVCQQLLNDGHELSVLIRNSEKVPSLKDRSDVKVFVGDLQNRKAMLDALQGQDACVHIALGWGETPLEMMTNDTLATAFLLEESEKAGLKHFVYTSSTAALGDQRKNMMEDICLRPNDLYGATKAASEAFVLGYSSVREDFQCNIVRPGYTFGNPVWEDSFTQPDTRFVKIVDKVLAGEDVEVIKHDGTQFIWAGDLAKIYAEILKSDLDRTIFHGLSSEFTTWAKIASLAVEMTGSSSKVIEIEKGWSAKAVLYDVSNIDAHFGFSFTRMNHIRDHLKYLIEQKKK